MFNVTFIKTTILFFLTLLAFSFSSNAQVTVTTPPLNYAPVALTSQTNGDIQQKTHSFNSKLFGNVLYQQDFDGGLPAGWSIVNLSPNNYQWKWDTLYQKGQFSLGTLGINSPTSYNGFMSLTADFFNTPIGGLSTPMDTYFESDIITIPAVNRILISYHQHLRYCCSAVNRLVLQVSTDNFITFQEFDATAGLPVNASNTDLPTGGKTNTIDITSAVLNATSFKIRFLAEGMTHYYWMIDDITILDGGQQQNDLGLSLPYLEFHDTLYTYNPFYTEIPLPLFPKLPFSGIIENHGINASSNVRLDVNVNHIRYPNGSLGLGSVYINSTNTIPSVLSSNSSQEVFSATPWFVPTELGDYSVNFLATSNNVDQNPGNETAILSFTISDTTIKKYDNTLSGGTGPASFVDYMTSTRGGSTGDKYATLFNIVFDSLSGNTIIPTSISLFLNTNSSNLGVEILPKIWEYREDSSLALSFGNEVASALMPTVINDTNQIVTIPFDQGIATTQGLLSGQYAVGWEVTSSNNGQSLEVYKDNSSVYLQAPVTTFVNFGHAPGWNWVRDVPAIQLNVVGRTITGIHQEQENTSDLSISPNPSKNGIFNIAITSINNKEYFKLKVSNSVGQVVAQDQMLVQKQLSRQLDLSSLRKGIYMVSLISETSIITKKVLIQ